MEVRGRKKLLDFMAIGDAKAMKLLPAWLHDVENAEWASPLMLKAHHITASFLRGNRVVFNVGGNDYRIVTMVDFARKVRSH